jgi:hypothetical protein
MVDESRSGPVTHRPFLIAASLQKRPPPTTQCLLRCMHCIPTSIDRSPVIELQNTETCPVLCLLPLDDSLLSTGSYTVAMRWYSVQLACRWSIASCAFTVGHRTESKRTKQTGEELQVPRLKYFDVCVWLFFPSPESWWCGEEFVRCCKSGGASLAVPFLRW